MRLVRLGAWCDVETDAEIRARLPAGVPGERRSGWSAFTRTDFDREGADSRPGVHFRVREFADLADGRRVTLHDERGFTSVYRVTGQSAPPADQWSHHTLASLERDVRNTVLPDDDDGEDHPWEWLAALLRAQGVEVPVEELRRVPYVVEFSERLRERVAAERQGAQ
jgi:hypothetical protein